MGFVAASMDEYPQVAALLLAMTADAGLHVREVRTVPGGFEVPDVVSSQLVPPADPAVPASPGISGDRTPPPGWDDPLPPVDVEFKPDGRVVLTDEAKAKLAGEPEDVDRETVRAWAKGQGLKVADSGRLSKAVLDAYAESTG
jgi:hypothetical protein